MNTAAGEGAASPAGSPAANPPRPVAVRPSPVSASPSGAGSGAGWPGAAAGPGSGFSDLAVSPFGTPLALLAGEIRVAFVGRTSTEDNQDPRNSMIRQLDRCRGAIPAAWVIAAHFYDVESGRMELDQRGRKGDYERFDIPVVCA